MKTKKDLLTIEAVKVNTQSGANDCGVFASEFCTSLAYGQEPSTIIIVHDQSKMTEDMIRCIENQKMTPFPIARFNRKCASNYLLIDVNCNCRCPYTGET